MNYTVYNKTTGQITSILCCSLESLLLSVDPQTESYLEGFYNDEIYYVENDAAIERPPKPSNAHIFNYSSKQWEDPRTAETEWPLIRAKRAQLLAASDWVVIKAMDTGTPIPTDWQAYRQALRDVTNQPDPFNITWPTPPQG